jgi:hypothetical protein
VSAGANEDYRAEWSELTKMVDPEERQPSAMMKVPTMTVWPSAVFSSQVTLRGVDVHGRDHRRGLDQRLIPTIGLFRVIAPVEPKKPASPKAKIPPSEATNQ